MTLRTSLFWVLGMTAALSVAGYGCSSTSGGGRRGNGGAAGMTGNNNAGNSSGGTANHAGTANNGGNTSSNGGSSNPFGGGSVPAGGGVMVKVPMGVEGTDAPMGDPTLTDATAAGTGVLATDTLQAGDEGDSVWVTQEDVDGDGSLDDVSTLIDDETGDKYVWYDTIISEFCSSGADANANVVLFYDAAEDYWSMLWDSDCPEDQGLVYVCTLDAEGSPETCGVCAVDAQTGELDCNTGGSTDPGGEPDAGGGSAGSGGDGDGDVTPPTTANPYECGCVATCDTQPVDLEPGGYCAESLEAAYTAVDNDCYALLATNGCIDIVCECDCVDSTAFTCDATAPDNGGR